jgi:recombinational DNA repair protein (RecF pathway)
MHLNRLVRRSSRSRATEAKGRLQIILHLLARFCENRTGQPTIFDHEFTSTYGGAMGPALGRCQGSHQLGQSDNKLEHQPQ